MDETKRSMAYPFTLWERLVQQPGLGTQILIASLIIHLLGLASSLFVIHVFNRYLGHGISSTLITLAAGLLLAVILEFGFRQARHRMAELLLRQPEKGLQDRLFAVLARGRIPHLERMGSQIHPEAMRAMNQLQTTWSPVNLLGLTDAPFSVLFCLAIFLLNGELGLAVLVVLVVMTLANFAFGRSANDQSSELAQSQARLGMIQASYQHLDLVRCANAAPWLERLLGERFSETVGHRRILHGLQSLLQSLAQSGQGLLTLVVISLGAQLVVAGKLDTGTLIGINLLSARALGLIGRHSQLHTSLVQAKQSLIFLKRLLEAPLESEQGTHPPLYAGRIGFADMAFHHPGSASVLFESLNLTLQPGALLLVHGGNGSGKTTLARLLMGLIDPARGAILADGIDLRQLQPAWWRRQVVYLPQEVQFFEGSLQDNLAILDPRVSEARLHLILREVGLERFVTESPEGLGRILTRGGASLPFGIRRRLALARAMVGDGRLVLLDEPFEGLDPDGCQQVARVIQNLRARGRTIILFSSNDKLLTNANWSCDLDVKPVPTVRANPQGQPPALQTEAAAKPTSLEPLPAPPPERPDSHRLQTLFNLGLGIAFGLLILWAQVGKLDIMSLAEGKIVPLSQLQQIQHLEGGIIREILVQEGQKVEAGQPMVVLDALANSSDLGGVLQKIRTHQVDMRRFMAEESDSERFVLEPGFAWPPSVSAWLDGNGEALGAALLARVNEEQLLRQTKELFQARREKVQSALRTQDEDIHQKEQDIAQIQARLKSLEQSVAIIDEQLSISTQMIKAKATSRFEHLGLLKEKTSLTSRISEDGALLKKGDAALKKAQEERRTLLGRFREEVGIGLEENQRKLNEAVLQFEKLADSLERTTIRAPLAGTIKTIHHVTIGGVVGPGETVLDLVPGDERLLVEARLLAADVGHVRLGQPAHVQLSSRDASRFGRLNGTVVHIGPDTLVTQEGFAYYQVRIMVEREYFENNDNRYDLVPGVVVSAGIITGTRSILETILSPFLANMTFALSER
ncbi:MAG: HlyD family type I secretion periplasmic adaptor subunit [Magnetococcales bacterium]|nr:HlyD family type I secretion periplasmic adaptor subunit [Magnetococcales bacterium]